MATPRQVYIAGALTLAAGIVGSLVAFWDLGKRRLEHFSAGAKYKTLENEARRAREIDAYDSDYSTFKALVAELGKRMDVLGEDSPQSRDFAYRVSESKLERARRRSEKKLEGAQQRQPPPA
jgi:hypothetical protein